jgi:hypothetical protein
VLLFPPPLPLTPPLSRAQQRHNETERQYKEVKRVMEELREGVRRGSAGMSAAAAAFTSLSRGEDHGGLARKLNDAADAMDDRCRTKAESALSSALAHVSDALNQLADRSRFEQRKNLLLDVDSYKRKVRDLEDKERGGGKVDPMLMRDKVNKLQASERVFTECNEELMAFMQAVNDAKQEHQEMHLLAACEAVVAFYCGSGQACAPLVEAVAFAKANPSPAKLASQQTRKQLGTSDRSDSPYGGSDNGGYNGGYPRGSSFDTLQGQMKGASLTGSRDPFASDPFAASAGGGRSNDPFASAQGVGAPALALPAPGGPAQRQATFDYAATEAGELTFAKGDVIDVLQEDASGWWQGRNARTGAVGAFPSNYTVEFLGGSGAPMPVAAPAGGDPFASFL